MAGLSVVIILLVWWLRRRSPTSNATIWLPALLRVGLHRLFLLLFVFPFVVICIFYAGLALFDSPAVGSIVATAIWIPAMILVVAPTPVLEWIVVPLRLPRVAYWIGRVCLPLGFADEPVGGGVVYGALALRRKGTSGQTVDWLRKKIDHTPPLRGMGVVTAGLLAAVRGDDHRARCLFLVADTLPSKLLSRKARAMARDWLVVDAARAGNWREVIRLGRRRTPSLRWSYAIARIAERLVGDKQAQPGWVLWLCWILAPRRRASLLLLYRALAIPRASNPLATNQSFKSDLPNALAGFARVLENGQACDGRSFAASVHAVNAALEHANTCAQVQQRLIALGARGDAEAVVAGFRGRVVDALANQLEEFPHLAHAEGAEPMIEQAIVRVRMRAFRDIRARCEDYKEREKSQSALEVVLEWEMWAVLRHAADRLLELDPASEAAVFQTMWPVCNNFAVFQHNICKRLMLAYEIYAWLQRHAQSAPSASELLLRNMKAASVQG
jgi:hypothetical protein